MGRSRGRGSGEERCCDAPERGVHGTGRGAYTVYTSRAKQVGPAKKIFFRRRRTRGARPCTRWDASVSSFAVGCVHGGHEREPVSRPIVYRGDTNASCSAPVVYTGDTSASCSAAG